MFEEHGVPQKCPSGCFWHRFKSAKKHNIGLERAQRLRRNAVVGCRKGLELGGIEHSGCVLDVLVRHGAVQLKLSRQVFHIYKNMPI